MPTIGAFCTNVPRGVRMLLEAPGLTTTLLGEIAPNTAMCVCVCHPLYQRVQCHRFHYHHLTRQGAIPLPSGGWPTKRPLGGLQTYLPNCCTSCHSTLSLFVSMVVHATSPKPFPSPLARVVVAPLQMRNFNVKTPSSLWTFHHAVPSPSFSTWELSVTENQCQSVFRSAVPLGC